MKAIPFKRFELAIALCALAANALAASPICVSNTTNAGDGSLRAAITQANNAGGGEITFCITGSVTLLSPLPSLTNITITGPGTNLLTVSGNNQVRVFSMNSGTTNTLSGLTIANGMATNHSFDECDYTYASGISNAGSLKLLSCAVRNCTSKPSYGGGIYNAGDMEMEASIIADCSGGLHGTLGGGIYNSGTLHMNHCSISRCLAMRGGGGVLNAGNLTMSASVVESCWTDSTSCDGGGILNWGTTAVLCGCTVADCEAFWGGGIASYSGNLAITNSTIVDNDCDDYGGGLICGTGTNWLVNCTITGNRCLLGAGICAWSDNETDCATIYANHCTIVSNTAFIGGGGVEGVICQNSIIAGNAPNDFDGVASAGYNLIQNTNGCTITGNQTGDIYGVDPLLGPLQDNGGPTWTYALLPGSHCIDQGTSSGLTTDQRGVPRPFDVPSIPNTGDGSDIGAYEWTPVPPLIPQLTGMGVSNGAPRFVLNGPVGSYYVVQASSNLVNWVPLSSILIPASGCVNIVDPPPTNQPRRFYRAVPQGGAAGANCLLDVR